jgi:TonB-dependent receptor
VELFRTVAAPGGGFTLGEPIRDIDQFARALSSARSLDAVDDTDAYTARFDASRQTALFTGDTTLAFGARIDQRTKEARESELLVNTGTQFTALGIPTTFLPVALPGVQFQGKIPLGYDFSYFNPDASRDILNRMRGAGSYQPINANFYEVQEQVFAGYGMGTVRYGWGNIVGGVRVEHIRNSSEAIVPLSGSPTRISVDNDQTLLFPSLHVNVNLDEEKSKKLRFSLNSGAARADYDQLRPNFTFNDGNLTISGGNPEAKPERAYGADAYFEWYVQPQGYVMLGAFYKKAKDVLFDSARTFGLDVLDTPGVDRSSYVFSTTINGGDGYLYGVEAALQQQIDPFVANLGLPAWVGGFGITANVTLNESEATRPNGSKGLLPGTSDYVFNVGAYYEKYGWSARLNYQKRAAWLDAILPAADGGDAYWAADDELDFSVRYAVRKNVEVYFDASNLLNQPGRRYSGSSIYTLEWERFGPRFGGGIRMQL